jgi:hypothetical protein
MFLGFTGPGLPAGTVGAGGATLGGLLGFCAGPAVALVAAVADAPASAPGDTAGSAVSAASIPPPPSGAAGACTADPGAEGPPGSVRQRKRPTAAPTITTIPKPAATLRDFDGAFAGADAGMLVAPRVVATIAACPTSTAGSDARRNADWSESTSVGLEASTLTPRAAATRST